ncbi:MAG TPA: PAS domain-containing sensor histidine kinase [Halothiobacillaceae bacterium]|nr:PAS domain-containing sensor histidine kinase [Halothiobacillaceae bacterium]
MDSHDRPAAHGDLTGGIHLTPAEWHIVFDAASDGIAILEPDLRIIRANHTLAGWCATSPEALGGRFCYDVIDRLDDAPSHCPAHKALETGTPAHANCDGRVLVRTCTCTAYPAPAPDAERSRRVILVVQEVAAQCQVERALRQCEARQRRFLDSAYEGVWEIDRQGLTVYANARLASILGSDDPAALVGRQLYEFRPRTSSGSSLFATRSKEETGEALECVLRRLDGSDVFVMLSVVPDRDDAGHFVGATLFVTDMTRYREMEAALFQAEARYHALFENATEAILVHDLSGRFLSANQLATWRLGYSLQDLLNMTVVDVEAAECAPGFPERILELQRYGRHLIETVHVTRDGRQIPTELSSQLVEYDGQPAVLLIARDLTERKQMQQALLRTERLAAMGQMAAALVHEINNPLQTMLSCIEATMNFPLDDEKRSRYLEVMYGETRRLNAITRRMLDFSRPILLDRQPVSIADVLDYTVTLTTRQLQQARVGMQLDMPKSLPMVWASRDELIQVFLNLIMNAVDVTPRGGQLRIAATARDARVEVTCTDTGPGFSEEILDHIFDAFFTTKENGTGLGLSVSRTIVEQHGGTLTAANASNGGAILTVSLPAHSAGHGL